jgi:hypothetical protein
MDQSTLRGSLRKAVTLIRWWVGLTWCVTGAAGAIIGLVDLASTHSTVRGEGMYYAVGGAVIELLGLATLGVWPRGGARWSR